MSGLEATIIIPTQDRPQHLRTSLRSVLRQQGVDFEVIVVDDGSAKRIDGVAGLDDPRVRLFTNDVPHGVSAARNRGTSEAAGSWIAFLDDDDLWAPDKLKLQLSALRATGRQWAYAGEVGVDGTLRVVSGSPPPPPEHVVAELDRYDAVPAGASNVVVASDLLRFVGSFDQRLTTSEDWDMWIRLARAALPAWVPRPLVAVRSDAVGVQRLRTMLAELDVVARRHGLHVDWPKHYRWAAWEALRRHERREAVRYYRAAIRTGDWRSLGRMAAALLVPRVAHTRQRPDPATAAWRAEAESWIGPLRAHREAA